MNPNDAPKNFIYVDLIERIQKNDLTALDSLVRMYRPVVMTFVYPRTGTIQDAEDLTQEILITVCEKINILKEPSAFPAWLKTITLNSCRGWFRRSRQWPEALDTADRIEMDSLAEQPLDVLINKDSQKIVRGALLKLPDANRIALLMHVWGEYSYEEIAMFIEIPVSTVVGRIHRAKAQLKRILKKDSINLKILGGWKNE